jgi:hypothetical protein
MPGGFSMPAGTFPLPNSLRGIHYLRSELPPPDGEPSKLLTFGKSEKDLYSGCNWGEYLITTDSVCARIHGHHTVAYIVNDSKTISETFIGKYEQECEAAYNIKWFTTSHEKCIVNRAQRTSLATFEISFSIGF